MYSKKAVKYYENGRVLHQQGSLLAAQKFYKKAININQNFGEAHNNLGNVLMDLAQYKEAEKSYREALHVTPDHPMILSNIGNALQRQGKNKEAIVWLNKSISIDHSYAEAYSNLGNVLRGLKNLDEAMVSYHKAIELKPNLAEPYANMGVILNDLGRLEDALDVHNQAIKIKPNYAEAYYNRGNTLKELGLLEEALDSYEKAIDIKPNYAEAYGNYGVVLRELGMIDKALYSYNKAIQINPDYVEAYSNYGGVLQDIGQFDRAVEVCEKAIKINTDYAEAHWNLSLVSLLLGDFKNGWREYEYGKLIKKNSRRVPHGVMYKVWGGESIVNKTIFVATEQGIGDEVFFASVIPDLIDKHPRKIILECDCRLELLFARSFPDASVRGKRTETNKAWLKEFGNIDFQIAIGSLPKFFRQDLSDFPLRKSFLLPHNGLKKKWRNRYNDLGDGMKVGISWRGGSSKILRTNRSIGLEILRPILLSNAFFINLQYGNCVDEIAEFKESSGVNVHDWDDADPLTDLENFAAEISELDLVISVDNSTVHFAGALGIPVWMLTPFSPDWRWMTRRKDSPWYKTIRLFRQKKFGDWYDVIDEIYSELQMIIK